MRRKRNELRRRVFRYDPILDQLTRVANLPTKHDYVSDEILGIAHGELISSGTDDTFGSELRATNPGTGQTRLVVDLHQGTKTLSSQPANLVVGDGLVFFTAETSATGRELFVSDGKGRGTQLVKDINPGEAGAFEDRNEFNGLIFQTSSIVTTDDGIAYFAADDGVSGRELWRSDGTEAGTWMVKDLVPGEGSSDPFELNALGHLVIFLARDENGVQALWKTNGTETGTRILADQASHGFRFGGSLQVVGDLVILQGSDTAHGWEPG